MENACSFYLDILIYTLDLLTLLPVKNGLKKGMECSFK